MKYFILFIISFIVAFSITPLIRKLALKVDAVDKFEIRKIHGRRIVTRLGGIAIFFAFYLTIPLLYFINRPVYFDIFPIFKGLLPASILILLLGIYDDMKGADAKAKFTVQIIAALIVIYQGIKINLITNPFYSGQAFDIGMWSIPVTIFWIIFITNAINLLDGLDGLAAGVSSIIALTMFFIALYQKNFAIMAISITLAGATIGFLRYNFNPAKIFMGDTGSQFIGFMLACISIKASHKSATTIAFLIPLIAMGLPIIDTLLAITRRIKKGNNIFKADNDHIHHKLIKNGLTHKNAVLFLYSISVALGIVAFIFAVIKDELIATVLFVLTIAIFIVVRGFNPKIAKKTS